ncbi:MAG TPA: pyridoxal phosphate-dependent aminotransferase [Pyrinomonadaceae bacterium]|nr:pyridoxal phosphate-dependent aminotransferase [Pyrinomonadaceae bacterium]
MTSFIPPQFLRGIEKSIIRQISDRAPAGSISLGLGEPDLPTADVIRRAAVRIIEQEQNGYTLQAGLPALRELVARDYPQLDLSAEEVIITAGSQEGLYLSLMTLVEQGDEVAMPDPGFVAYPTIVQMAGGKSVYYRLPANKDFGFDLEEFRSSLSEKTKVVICTSPSNPTGRAFSATELSAMARAIHEKSPHAFVVSDEIYRELYYTDERPPSISEFFPRTIVISGLSKSMSMTGWRLGWICGDADVIKAALVLHGYVTTCASTISQKAALASWTTEGEEARSNTRRIFAERRAHLLGLFSENLKLKAVAPDGAFYTMLDVRSHGSSMQVAEQFLANRVVTIPGSAFGNEGEGFLRVSFCAELPVLTEGVARMKAALNK